MFNFNEWFNSFFSRKTDEFRIYEKHTDELHDDIQKKVEMKIPIFKETQLDESRYYKVKYPKKQIFIHHTVSNPNSIEGDIDSWNRQKSRIATAFIISHDGTINRCFDDSYWAYHLGIASKNPNIDKNSIGIELDAWGGLIKNKECYFNTYGGIVSNFDIVELKKAWRGFTYFQKYSKQQVDSLYDLCKWLCVKHNIAFTGGMTRQNIDYNKNASDGEEGIWSHTSVNSTKSDIYPDEYLLTKFNNG